MAKEFSKPFYRTKAWKDARRIVLHRAHWMCERCGKPATEIHHRIRLTPDNMWDPRITLNHDNLMALCEECHQAQHRTKRWRCDEFGKISL